jgi:muramidase (phage lysozyme)
MSTDLEEIAENIRRAHELLSQQAPAPAQPPLREAVEGNAPDTSELRERLTQRAAAAPPAPTEAVRRVPLQTPVTPATAPAVGGGANPNVPATGQSLQAQAYQEALRANPGPRPLAPVAPPAPGTAPAQLFQPNGPTVGQRVGEFIRSEAGAARPAAVPMPAAAVPAPVDPAAGAQLRAAIEQAAAREAPAREALARRMAGGAPASPTATAATTPAAPSAGAATPEAPWRGQSTLTGNAPAAAAPVAPPATGGGSGGARPPATAPAASAGGAQNRMVAPFKKIGQVARGAGSAAAGLTAIDSMGRYRIDDPAADSSAGGTLDALKRGQFGEALHSAGKGLLETAMDAGGFAANTADVFLPGQPASQAYERFLKSQLGDRLKIDQTGALARTFAPAFADWWIAQRGINDPKNRATLRPEAQARVNAGETANVGNDKPAAPSAAPGAAMTQAAMTATAPPPLDPRLAALRAQLDADEQKEPGRILGLNSSNMADPASWFWRTADGRTIRKPVAATPEESKLLDRLRVRDARGEGGTFDHEGRQYANVQYGLDTNGIPVYRAVSLDGKALTDPRQATDLLRRYDEIGQRTGPLSPEDAAAVARYEERQKARKLLDGDASIDAEGAVPANAAPAARPPASAAPAAAPKAAAARDTIGPKAAGYQPFSFVADPQARANLQIFAHALAGAEDHDYNKIVGGGRFDDFSKHPGQVGLKTKDGPSTAAGRYGITGTTYRALSQQGGYKDFTPETQDRMEMALLHQSGAMRDVVAGNFDGAMKKVGGIWQGVPSGTSKNQGKRTPEQWAQLVAEGRQLYGGAAPGAQIAQAAPAAPPAWLDPGQGVQIMRPGGEHTQAVPAPDGGAMLEIPQAAYQAVRQAAAADPKLGARMQPTTGGVLVDGAAVPPEVLGGGTQVTDAYLTRRRAGLADQVDPQDAKRQLEALRLDAAKSRYVSVSQGKTDTGAELPHLLYDTHAQKWVDAPGAAGAGLQPTPEDIANLRKRGDKAAFDAVYGPGAADRALTTSPKK